MDVVVTSEARARHPRASVQESADQGVAPLNIPENDTDSPKSGSLTLDMALLGTTIAPSGFVEWNVLCPFASQPVIWAVSFRKDQTTLWWLEAQIGTNKTCHA